MRMLVWWRGRRKTIIAASTALLILAAISIPAPFVAPAAQARTIDVSARQFAFEPATLRVQRGDTVTIHLESLDAVHGLFIDGYDVDIQAEPGKSADVTFVADKEGKFKVRCSITCGPLHPFMIGELEVAPDLPLARALVAMAIATFGALLMFWQ